MYVRGVTKRSEPLLSRRPLIELVISSKPTRSIRKDTIIEETYSIRAWPKGCSLSAGFAAILKLTKEIMEDPASDKLLRASATIAIEKDKRLWQDLLAGLLRQPR